MKRNSNAKNMKVDFMIIGAQKCGTTGLAANLAAHPKVSFSREKEPGYFNIHQDWKSDLASYHSLFADGVGQIYGEASTMYTFIPEWVGTHQRLFQYNPDLKLIYIMRNPVDRIISNYAHRLVRGTVNVPPEDAVFAEPTYMSRSRYAMQIDPYLETFGRDKIKLLIFEEYIADQDASMAKIAQFLNIAPDEFPASSSNGRHASVGKWYLKPPLRKIAKKKAVVRFLSKIPQGTKDFVRPLLSKKLDHAPYFSNALRESIWKKLEADISGIESILGRSIDAWQMHSETNVDEQKIRLNKATVQ